MEKNILSRSDYHLFNKAKDVAGISDFKKIHIGCVAVYKGNIIGVGFNTNKTHPIQNYYNRYRINKGMPKLHAEINCLNQIRHLNIDFSKVKLYVNRICKDQEYAICRPCPSCMAAIKDLGIQNIYYTTNEGYAYEKIRRN